MSWDKVSDLKIANNSQLVGGSCMSNFVSIYEIDLDNYLAGPEEDDNNNVKAFLCDLIL